MYFGLLPDAIYKGANSFMSNSKLLDFDYTLPATAIELLLVLVETAKQYQIQTITCREVQTRDKLSRTVNDQQLSPSKDPLSTLQNSGLVKKIHKHRVYLYPDAFERARYERENWLGKQWIKANYWGRRYIKGVLYLNKCTS